MIYDFGNGHTYNQKELWTEDFIREHKDELNWTKLAKKVTLSEQFIEEMINYVDWKSIFLYQPVSEDFIERHIEKLTNFDLICAHRLPSIEFVERHKLCFHWGMLSQQKLTDEFLRAFRDDVDWRLYTIHNCYDFTESFMREFKDYIDWMCLMDRITLSNDMKREIALKMFKKNESKKGNILRYIGKNMVNDDWAEWSKNIDNGDGRLERALNWNHHLTEDIIIPNAIFFDYNYVRMMRNFSCSRKLKHYIEKYPDAFGKKFSD